MRGKHLRRGRKRLREQRALGREPVEVRRRRAVVPARSHVIRAERIDDDDEHPAPDLLVPWARSATRDREEEERERGSHGR